MGALLHRLGCSGCYKGEHWRERRSKAGSVEGCAAPAMSNKKSRHRYEHFFHRSRSSQTGNQKKEILALKVQKSAEHYTEAAVDEIDLLEKVGEKKRDREKGFGEKHPGLEVPPFHCVTLVTSFIHPSPHGEHMCMVFTLHGQNLLWLVKHHNYQGIPVSVVKELAWGILEGLDFLHEVCGIIHTDLTPENVLMRHEYEIGGTKGGKGKEEVVDAAEKGGEGKVR